jgi:hypothetical protein
MYKLDGEGIIIKDGSFIPMDINNKDYQEYLIYIANGGTVQPADPIPQHLLDIQAANNYAKLVALRAMTPAQVSAFVETNVTNLNQIQDAIKTLAIAVAILARRL